MEYDAPADEYRKLPVGSVPKFKPLPTVPWNGPASKIAKVEIVPSRGSTESVSMNDFLPPSCPCHPNRHVPAAFPVIESGSMENCSSGEGPSSMSVPDGPTSNWSTT